MVRGRARGGKGSLCPPPPFPPQIALDPPPPTLLTPPPQTNPPSPLPAPPPHPSPPPPPPKGPSPADIERKVLIPLVSIMNTLPHQPQPRTPQWPDLSWEPQGFIRWKKAQPRRQDRNLIDNVTVTEHLAAASSSYRT